MTLQLYNTLTRQKDTFTPIHSDRVDFYSCGPTVYNTVHIGNLRAFLAADTLQRWLRFGLGHNVRWVMNITDVDDKTIRDSQKQYPDLEPMEALRKFTRHYEELFFADLETLNIQQESFYETPRGTEFIPEMQDLISKIVENGIGYEKDGSFYFSIEKYVARKNTYGKLQKLDLSSLKSGTRTLADEIEKENLQDFVLWKAQKEGEPAWDFTFQGKNYPGRPGWHIECCAMEYATFGELPFDIHSGGIDLCFPHHEDEIAQSVAGYGVEPTNFWLHNEHLMVEGEKMSKSLGNFYTLHDLLEKGHKPDVIRFFLVTNHYRTKLNLSEEALNASHEALQRIRNCAYLRQCADDADDDAPENEHQQRFIAAMNDDLNAPKALAAVFQAIEEQNTAKTDIGLLSLFQLAQEAFGVRLFPDIQEVPADIQRMVRERQEAKQAKDFTKADRLRDAIQERGYQVRDSGDGCDIVPMEL